MTKARKAQLQAAWDRGYADCKAGRPSCPPGHRMSGVYSEYQHGYYRAMRETGPAFRAGAVSIL